MSAPVLIVDDHELVGTSLLLSLRAEGLDAHLVCRGDADGVLSVTARLATRRRAARPRPRPRRAGEAPRRRGLVGPLTAAGWKVIILSGSTDRVGIGAALDAGALAWVPKNAPLPALLAAVRAAQDGRPVMATERRDQLIAWSRRLAAERDALTTKLARLSQREREVLAMLAQGRRAQAVAEHFVVSLATVRTQIRAVLVEAGGVLAAGGGGALPQGHWTILAPPVRPHPLAPFQSLRMAALSDCGGLGCGDGVRSPTSSAVAVACVLVIAVLNGRPVRAALQVDATFRVLTLAAAAAGAAAAILAGVAARLTGDPRPSWIAAALVLYCLIVLPWSTVAAVELDVVHRASRLVAYLGALVAAAARHPAAADPAVRGVAGRCWWRRRCSPSSCSASPRARRCGGWSRGRCSRSPSSAGGRPPRPPSSPTATGGAAARAYGWASAWWCSPVGQLYRVAADSATPSSNVVFGGAAARWGS